MENNKKVYSLMGLAMRAGKLVSGEFMTERAIKEGIAQLIVVAEDASENTKKNFKDSGIYYKVPMVIFGKKAELGHALGKEIRASLAITEAGFAQSIQKLLSDSLTENKNDVTGGN